MVTACSQIAQPFIQAKNIRVNPPTLKGYLGRIMCLGKIKIKAVDAQIVYLHYV